MGKSKTSSYTLTLPLKIEPYQEYILNKRFEKCRKIYNSCLGEALKRYNHMIESKQYRAIKNIKDEKLRNMRYEECNEEYGLTKKSLQRYVTPMYNYFGIESKTAQNQSHKAFTTIQKLMFHKAKKVNFIKYNELTSVQALDNRQGITYRDGYIIWMKTKFPIIIKSNDVYGQKAIQDRVKFCRILRKDIKGKTKFYAQLILEGIPPVKINKETGEIRGSTGIGTCGIDIGTQTIAISSKIDVHLLELAPSINNIDRQIKLLQRRMDRSRRSMNLNKYNEDGAIKSGNRDKWIYSNHYMKLKSQRKELYRKETEIRKQDHYKMINKLLILGNKFYVEDMNYQALQKRAKNTTINEKTGKINKKKRFGKSLGNKAPAMFLTMLNNKLKYNNEQLYKIDTKKCKASQYNHFTGEYNKKELKNRWNKDIEIQRDTYSAFLIMNVNEDLKSINREKCIKTYDNFKILHDKEIKRLKELKKNGIKLISSMGI
ncbi:MULTISPECIES: transposase [unclassified Clostridium]|uniref:transposase n=1 Tax=unclassified Clostridium TaxID=2614128 RepID=UPI002079B9CF|nr:MULTISPECIES: transposase [unclassified Clostridium]